MKKHLIRNRKVRYGGIAAVLTVLVITVTVLTNAVFSSLATRYSWYKYMNPAANYDVTDDCYALLDDLFADHAATKTEIIFCNTEANVQADDTQGYLYHTARSLAERYPQNIKLTFYDIVTNPNTVRPYTTTLNPVTGETVETKLASTNVIIVNGDYHRVYELTEFFVFKDGNTANLWAYNGEKKLAAGILHAVEENPPIACLTNNHGEVFYDYEMVYLLDDAGYSVRFIDLYKEEIPEGCELIISYNPNTDMMEKGTLSQTSEAEKLDAFLSVAGNNFLVLLENGTPKLPNFEVYLEQWGVKFSYDPQGERSYRYMLQDSANSLTSDGYTVYGAPMESGHSQTLLTGLSDKVVFKNATAFENSRGFISNGDGSYTAGNRTLYSLYTGSNSAVCWANGLPVADGNDSILMSVTEQKGEGGSSYVGVVASVDFSSEEFLQSAVYENTDVMMRLFGIFGKEYTPEGLTIKPFASQDISTITTRQMLWWTIGLALTPTVIVTATAVVVLIKRRRA